MNLNEKEYKMISNYTGLALIIFIVILNVTTILSSGVFSAFSTFMPYNWSYSADSVVSMIGYLATFIAPAVILRAILKKKGVLQPLNLEYNTPKSSFLLIPATIAIVLVSAYINSLILAYFGTNEAYSELVGATSGPYEVYQILLLFLSGALVPAVCEEFLFRGTILSNLLPFGRGVAIVGSSVLFGLMHQNPYQLIYTTVAGLMLGYAYVETKSIWIPTFIHFFNNAFSVSQQIIYANCREGLAEAIVIVMDMFIFLSGIACLIIYKRIASKKKKKKYENGSFSVILESSESYEQKPVRRKIRCFFSAWMIVFVILALLSMLIVMGTLLIMQYSV